MRRVWALAAVCLLVTVAVAAAQTDPRPRPSSGISAPQHLLSADAAPAVVLFGHRSAGRTVTRFPTGGAHAFRFRSFTLGSARSIAVYVDRHSRARTLVVGLYSDRRGRPGSLLTSGSRRLRRAGGWVSVTVRPAGMAKTFYWIAVQGKGAALLLRGGAERRCKGKSSYVSHVTKLPARWRKGRISTACPISAYVSGKRGVVGGVPVGGGTQGGGTQSGGTGTGNVNLPPGARMEELELSTKLRKYPRPAASYDGKGGRLVQSSPALTASV